MTIDATRIIDISFPLHPKTYRNNLPQKMLDHFSGRPIGFEIDTLLERGSTFSSGQVARGVKMRLHAGTHVDAPEHWVAGGKHIEEIPLDTFIGEALVADFQRKSDRPITDRDLDERVGHLVAPGCRLLIKTGWNDRFFDLPIEDWKTQSPYLTTTALAWCVGRKMSLIGIDFYHGAGEPATDHHERFEAKLAHAGILTLTNLFNLRAVNRDKVFLVALPLALQGVEAAPVRAIVLES